MHNSNDFYFTRVPYSARRSLFTLVMVRIGIMTALGQFMLGAMLGHSMSFYDTMIATFLGSMLLEVISLGLGIAAAREGFIYKSVGALGRIRTLWIGISECANSIKSNWFVWGAKCHSF